MNNLSNRLKQFFSEYWFPIVFTVIFALIFYYNGILGVSPHQDGDNFVFRNSAYFMKRGLFIYKDFVDNKGPYLYFINYLFFLFDEIHLIFYVTLILGIITNIYIYKIAKLNLNSFNSNLVMVLSNGLLLVYTKHFAGGITNNMVEFYAMPIFAYTYYKYLENKSLTKISIIVLGFLCGILINLRVNLASISVICSFFIILNYFKDKNYKDILQYIGFYALGVFISYIPIIIYFAYAGSFKHYIDSYIFFNLRYNSALTEENLVVDSPLLSHLIKGFMIILYFSFNIYSILVLIIYLISIIKYKKNIDNFIIYVFCFFVATLISVRYYYHYVWIMIPLVSYPLSLMFKSINTKKLYKIVSIVCVLSTIFIYVSNMVLAFRLKLDNDVSNEEYYQLVEYMERNMRDENKKVFFMIAIVNDCYIDSKMLPPGNYVFQYSTRPMLKSSMESFKKDRPKYVVADTARYPKLEWLQFMFDELENNYNKVYENAVYEVYEIR